MPFTVAISVISITEQGLFKLLSVITNDMATMYGGSLCSIHTLDRDSLSPSVTVVNTQHQ